MENVSKRCLMRIGAKAADYNVRLRISSNVEQPPLYCCFIIAILLRGNIKSVGTVS